MHECSSFDSGHYYSGILYFNTGIWWHSDDEKVTQISDFSEGVYISENKIKLWVLFYLGQSETTACL